MKREPKLRLPVEVDTSEYMPRALVRQDDWRQKYWELCELSDKLRWLRNHWAQFLPSPQEVADGRKPSSERDSWPGCSGVYFLYLAGDLQYVGKATCLSSRLHQHYYPLKPSLIPADWFDEVSWVETPDEFAETIEAFYINRLSPPKNIASGRGFYSFREYAKPAW